VSLNAKKCLSDWHKIGAVVKSILRPISLKYFSYCERAFLYLGYYRNEDFYFLYFINL